MPAGNETYDVFVSYSRADSLHARDIDSALCANGLKSFFDRRNLDPGLPWVRALEKAIGAAKSAIVLIGPGGFGNTQQYERELAIIRQTREPDFRVIPVILPDTRSDIPFDFLRNLTQIDFSHVAKVSEAPDQLERLLQAIRGRLPTDREGLQAICPWRGLDAFREEDAALFFGRGSGSEPESPVGQLVSKVREHSFVMVVGRSGSGRSSLVFAGLVPALRCERAEFRGNAALSDFVTFDSPRLRRSNEWARMTRCLLTAGKKDRLKEARTAHRPSLPRVGYMTNGGSRFSSRTLAGTVRPMRSGS
jgi:hypothetical protein